MRALAPAALLLVLTGCNQNSSAGADREAQVDPAPTAAPRISASKALAGIATEAIAVETMSDADLDSLGRRAGDCSIRLTEVGKPSLVYEDGISATIKLNGKLITLPHSQASTYSDGGLSVTLKPLEWKGNAGLREVQMRVLFPGEKNEHGYSGYGGCNGKAV